MPKRKIKATIENSDNEVITTTTAIYQDKIIKYKEDDNSTVVYNYKKHKLTRENTEIKIEYIFSEGNETTGLLFIKDLNKTININIKTKKIEEDKINSLIEFEIDKEKFKYKIEAVKWVY